MKNILTTFIYILAAALSGSLLTSCQAVGDIFSAGVYTGISLVVVLIIIVFIIIARLSKK